MEAIGGSERDRGLGEEPMFAFGRERRLHARAYEHWVSLLNGRRMPALDDLDPDDFGAFADHGVLIELKGPGRAPGIAYLGRALREEAGPIPARPALAQVPGDSLLAVLIARLPAMLGAGAPLGFEGELPKGEDRIALHRGILLPFAGPDGALAAVLGVMNWKRVAAAIDTDIVAAVESAFALRVPPPPVVPWGDGPGAAAMDDASPAPRSLDRRLAAARALAMRAAPDRPEGTASSHAALGAAHDLLLAAREEREAFDALAMRMGTGRRALPFAVAELIFAHDDMATRRLYGAVLARAERLGIGAGRLADTLDRWEGGPAAFVAPRRAAAMAFRPAPLAVQASDADAPLLRGHRPPRAAAARRSAA